MYGEILRITRNSGVKSEKKQECIPVGCVPSAAVAVCWGGVCLGGGVCPGVSAQGGVCPGGCLHRGVSAQGVCIPACTGPDTPCGQNDRQV